MNLLTFLPLLLLLAPSLLAQGVQQCRSCCPDVEAPVPETVACDTLDSHLEMMKEAIEEAGCDDSSELESEEVCHAITMKAIPPCMLMEGTNEQAKCLADAAQDIEEELGIDEEAGAEVVSKCKCEAFKKIREALSSVRDMMCPPSDSDRKPRNYYGYGANTLWFQYILCQQESIPSLACWLFTSGWNQAEFGQYYLYDNLLNSEEGGLLDGDLLPILVLSGGLSGGSYAPAHGGHPVYRRSACEDGDEMTADGCKPPRTRRSDSPACDKGDVLTPSGCIPHSTSRKRRSGCDEDDTAEECKRKHRRSVCDDDDTAEECKRKHRRSVCDEDDTAEECKRKHRRSVCDDDDTDEECSRKQRRSVCDEDDTTEECNRKQRRSVCDKDDTAEECNRKQRRSVCDKDDTSEECRKQRRSVCDEDDTAEECRKQRRSVCDDEGKVWTAKGCVDKPSRKRRSSDPPPPKCNDGEVLAPSGCRKRRSALKCTDGELTADGNCV